MRGIFLNGSYMARRPLGGAQLAEGGGGNKTKEEGLAQPARPSLWGRVG